MDDLETSDTLQFLTFRLADETYALDVARTREIVDYTPITQIPRTPTWMRGVINLRGNVVPVVDLRQKLGFPATERTVHTVIVLLELIVGGAPFVLGVLVDAVQEVFEVEPEQIGPPPSFGRHLSTEFIRGMGNRNGQLFIVLDVARLFSAEEIGAVESAAGPAAA